MAASNLIQMTYYAVAVVVAEFMNEHDAASHLTCHKQHIRRNQN